MSDGGIEDSLSERMHRFDKQMRPEIETTFIAGWADEVAVLEAKLERHERREDGEEFCEAHEDWLPIEEMHMDSEGVWLCQEAWDELVNEQGVTA